MSDTPGMDWEWNVLHENLNTFSAFSDSLDERGDANP